jgi:hypothetical protein
MLESKLYTPIIMKATVLGCRLLRNNVGCLKNERGQWVRFGVANPGGSDLLGVLPCVVTKEMVGLKVGILLAVEVKPERNNRLSRHQKSFLDFVSMMGGIALKAIGPEDFEAQIKRVKSDLAAGLFKTT